MQKFHLKNKWGYGIKNVEIKNINSRPTMRRFFFIYLTVMCASFSIFSAAGAKGRLQAFDTHLKMKNESIFRQIKWENLGPYFTGGRIVDIEAYEHNPHKFLVASAAGGVWITENNGTTWSSIFDKESSTTIGDIAVSQSNENLIWVGTGEANSSPSAYAGTGVFKSTDAGLTWENLGLQDTHHIGRLIIDPQDNNTVYVAALGHLYSENEERGIFKTTDGGKTWEKVLYISPKTGAVDLVMHPENRSILYAACWQKERKPWNLTAGGEESAIYKTSSGGITWEKKVNGLPQDKYVGRIGLAISRSNPNVLYALLDNQEPRPVKTLKDKREKSGITIEMLMDMSIQDFLKLDNKKVDLFLKEHMAPKTYDARIVKMLLRIGQITPKVIASMLLETREKLHTMVIGAEVYRSIDAGENWVKTHPAPLDSEIFLTYGFYFGQIRISPDDENTIYLLGIPLLKSTNGGRTFTNISSPEEGTAVAEVHVDSHAMWIDPNQPRRILLGTDGGLNISYDQGATWQKPENLSLAQCYTVNYDFQQPYHIYTGLQDNGVVVGPRSFRFGTRINIWWTLLGADGASVEPRKDDPTTIYAAAQFGEIFRLDLNKRTRKSIKPQPDRPSSSYRFNWLAPFMISRHESSTLYLGANKMFKSTDRGDNWISLSPDLTNQQHTHGNIPYPTISTIDESPFTPAILYAGTDDGIVWVTQDSGKTWKKISALLPGKWVSRLIASRYKKERVYVTMTGRKEDDFKTYVFVSHDFGRNWENLKANLPDEPVNVLREDPANSRILYLGTDLGVYISLDQGESWHSLNSNLPTTPVCDLCIHPRHKELIIGSHGRGVFVLPVKTIQQLTADVLERPLYFFEIEPLRLSSYPAEEDKVKFEFYTRNSTQVTLQIRDKTKKIIKSFNLNSIPGLNQVDWDLFINKEKNIKLEPGDYQVLLKSAGARVERSLKIQE